VAQTLAEEAVVEVGLQALDHSMVVTEKQVVQALLFFVGQNHRTSNK
jgi:hypothetical protein